ncbi:hypothetical protein AACH10_08730 [Ideonella sp. DXS22W]|uniref:SPOR domain-containing protein n=1 Tax=Pseudaquabacterium inlustre TaxID=2984192 RepID=A0ABU9CEM7_9BURK
MPAKPLHEVLARVVAWHNRHPLALRISPQQVHSIGGVALPFASAQRPPEPPPALDEVLNPPADDPMASFLAAAPEAADPAETLPAVAVPPQPPGAHAGTDLDGDAPPLPPLPELPPIDTVDPATQAAPGDALPQDDIPPADTAAAPDADGHEAPAGDDAPIELAMALDEAPAAPDADAPSTPAPAPDIDSDVTDEAAADADAAPAAPADGEPERSPDPAATAPEPATDVATDAATEVLTAPNATAPDHGHAAQPPAAADADPPTASAEPASASDAAETPLAERLRAARERAQAAAPAPLDLDIGLDGPTAAPAALPAATALTASPDAPGADAAPAGNPRGWRARLAAWGARVAARLAALRPRRRPAGGALTALFQQDFMWPRTPAQVARWVQRHGSEQPLAPADWPQRVLQPDAALLHAARRKGRPHAVTRHVLTAAIGVGDRRIRLLIDADGHVLGPRAFDRRRINRLAGAGSLLGAALLTAVLGPWRHASAPADPHAAGATEAAAAASQAEAASAAMAAASAASDAAVADGAHAAASGTSGTSGTSGASATDAHAHAAHAAPDAHPAPPAPPAAALHPAPAAPANPAVQVAHAPPATQATTAPAADAHAAAHPPPAPAPTHAHAPAPAPAEPEPPASSFTVTQVPPPAYPVTRASGPIVAIRFRLSEEAKQAARDEVAAARAAVQGEPPPPSPAKPPRRAPAAPLETPVRVAQKPGVVYAVITRPMPQRASAEAILAQMMSVRARLPQTAPDQGEVMQHQGRWRAVWWPFTSLAEAERAQVMLVTRGMHVEVIEF